MKRYKVKIPRMAVAIAALAMAVFIFGLVVIVPALASPGGDESLAATTTRGAPAEVAVSHDESRWSGFANRGSR